MSLKQKLGQDEATIYIEEGEEIKNPCEEDRNQNGIVLDFDERYDHNSCVP